MILQEMFYDAARHPVIKLSFIVISVQKSNAECGGYLFFNFSLLEKVELFFSYSKV